MNIDQKDKEYHKSARELDLMIYACVFFIIGFFLGGAMLYSLM